MSTLLWNYYIILYIYENQYFKNNFVKLLNLIIQFFKIYVKQKFYFETEEVIDKPRIQKPKSFSAELFTKKICYWESSYSNKLCHFDTIINCFSNIQRC